MSPRCGQEALPPKLTEKREKELATCNAQRSAFNSDTNAGLSLALCLLHIVFYTLSSNCGDNVKKTM